MNIQNVLKTSGLNINQDIILIGNGPSVLTSTTLANAEKSKLIARCNDYVTSGFEDKVGTRTDIWCVGDYVYEELSKKKTPQLFTLVTHPKETRNGRPYKYSDNVFSVYADDFDEVKNTFSKFKGICAHPSTGLLATMALSETFKDVYIAGFDFFEFWTSFLWIAFTRLPGNFFSLLTKVLLSDTFSFVTSIHLFSRSFLWILRYKFRRSSSLY